MSPNYKTIHNTMKGFTAWFNLFHGSFCWCAVKRFLIWDHSDSLTPLLDDSSPNPMPIYLGCDSYHLVREQLKKTNIICAMGQRHSSTPLSKNTWYLFQFERRHTKINFWLSYAIKHPPIMGFVLTQSFSNMQRTIKFLCVNLIELLFANSHPIFL